ncbi:MAG: ATP F0F1 synthase subunit B [Rhodobacteraceae bacterium]|nr:ATP F0F1 synthase subunit B [Paracoccaceae bacterium]
MTNTNFIVLIAFLIFLGILYYFKVPGMIGDMLDKRAAQIRADLEEARSLREEAQKLLASYQRKQDEVKAQADRIVVHARQEAEEAAAVAKADLARSIERRLRAAEDQIASAEASALKEVKDRAAAIAVAAAGDVIAKAMTAKDAGRLIDDAIATVEAKLH